MIVASEDGRQARRLRPWHLEYEIVVSIAPINLDESGAEQDPGDGDSAASEDVYRGDGAAAVNVPAEELTVDEWKRQQELRLRPQFQRR